MLMMAKKGLGSDEHLWPFVSCDGVVFTFSMLQTRPTPAPGGVISAKILGFSDIHMSLSMFSEQAVGLVLL